MPVADRSHVHTEQRNPRSARLHEMSVDQIVGLIQEEDGAVLEAVRAARPAITRLLDDAERRWLAGGRLIYLGAGTSGRLGVLDASECPPTFQTPPERVVGIIAGGDGALRRSSEGAEDDPRGAVQGLESLKLDWRDVVVGIAAGGTTPYVLGALEWAGGRESPERPLTAMIACTSIGAELTSAGGGFIDHPIELRTGPEVVTGSTRMKAGTATKLVLNTISTTLMVREGRVFENLMVDLRASNAKLRDRAARIVMMLTKCSRDEAFALLDAAGSGGGSGGSVKTAVVMKQLGLSREASEERLIRWNGHLGHALRSGPVSS